MGTWAASALRLLLAVPLLARSAAPTHGAASSGFHGAAWGHTPPLHRARGREASLVAGDGARPPQPHDGGHAADRRALLRSERRPAAPHSGPASFLAEGLPDRDCRFGQWGHWGPCSRRCSQGSEHGKRWRTREIVQETYGSGQECHEGSMQQEPCNIFQCEEPCQWDQWTEWSGCSCGIRSEHRNRTLKAYASGGHDKTCDLDAGTDTRSCAFKPCPVNCEWHDWGGWSDCDKVCGGGWSHGHRTRTPAKYGGENCAGEPREDRQCNLQACDIDCSWGPWSSSECNATCGGGVRERARAVDRPQSGNGAACNGPTTIHEVCNDDACPVDCLWGNWEPWGECSKSCRRGSQNRSRGVLVTATHGGAPCAPEGGVEFQNCNERVDCPIDCVWLDWKSWTECSVVCGTGVRTRARGYIQEERGGRPCSDSESTQTESCRGLSEHCPKEESIIDARFHDVSPDAGGSRPLGAHRGGVLGTVLIETEHAREFVEYCRGVHPHPPLNDKLCALEGAITEAIRLAVSHRWIEEHGISRAAPAGYTVEVSFLSGAAWARPGSSFLQDVRALPVAGSGQNASDPTSLLDAVAEDGGGQGNVTVHFDIPRPLAEVFEVIWTVSTEALRGELNHQLSHHELRQFHVSKVFRILEGHVQPGELVVQEASEVRVQAEHHPRLPPESVHTRYFGPAHVRPALADGEASSGAGAAGRAGAGANASAGLSTSSGGQSAGEEIVEAAKALGEKFVGEVNTLRVALENASASDPAQRPSGRMPEAPALSSASLGQRGAPEPPAAMQWDGFVLRGDALAAPRAVGPAAAGEDSWA